MAELSLRRVVAFVLPAPTALFTNRSLDKTAEGAAQPTSLASPVAPWVSDAARHIFEVDLDRIAHLETKLQAQNNLIILLWPLLVAVVAAGLVASDFLVLLCAAGALLHLLAAFALAFNGLRPAPVYMLLPENLLEASRAGDPAAKLANKWLGLTHRNTIRGTRLQNSVWAGQASLAWVSALIAVAGVRLFFVL